MILNDFLFGLVVFVKERCRLLNWANMSYIGKMVSIAFEMNFRICKLHNLLKLPYSYGLRKNSDLSELN